MIEASAVEAFLVCVVISLVVVASVHKIDKAMSNVRF